MERGRKEAGSFPTLHSYGSYDMNDPVNMAHFALIIVCHVSVLLKIKPSSALDQSVLGLLE